MSRAVVIGSPRAGKTTYALARGECEGVPVRHTDDLISAVAWSEVSRIVAEQWFSEPGPWIIEGVAAVRALRKWLAANAEGKPCDEVIVLERPHVELTPGQACMAKACATIWAQIEAVASASGVRIEVAPDPIGEAEIWREWFAESCSGWNEVEDIEAELGRDTET